jgi:hypothetical protein
MFPYLSRYNQSNTRDMPDKLQSVSLTLTNTTRSVVERSRHQRLRSADESGAVPAGQNADRARMPSMPSHDRSATTETNHGACSTNSDTH